MTEHYVYLYTDPSRQEPIYVGLGKNKRAWAHLKSKKMHPFIQRLEFMRRNGIAPVITFLCTGIDREFACLLEQEAINKFGRKDLGKGPLLNLTDGGDGGLNLIVSSETRSKQSVSIKLANARPGVNERRAATLSATCKLPEVKAQRSKIQTKIANDPLVKAKKYKTQCETNMTAETRQKRADGQAQRWSDPSARKRRSQQSKAYWAKRRDKNESN